MIKIGGTTYNEAIISNKITLSDGTVLAKQCSKVWSFYRVGYVTHENLCSWHRWTFSTFRFFDSNCCSVDDSTVQIFDGFVSSGRIFHMLWTNISNETTVNGGQFYYMKDTTTKVIESHHIPQIRNFLQHHIPKPFRISRKAVWYPEEQSFLVFYRWKS